MAWSKKKKKKRISQSYNSIIIIFNILDSTTLSSSVQTLSLGATGRPLCY